MQRFDVQVKFGTILVYVVKTMVGQNVIFAVRLYHEEEKQHGHVTQAILKAISSAVYQIFLGFTTTFCSKSEWGSNQNVLMIILYWSEQISRNCTYLLPNKSSTHTVKNYFSPLTVYRFRVDPQ